MKQKILIGCIDKQIAEVYHDQHSLRYVEEVLRDEEYKFLLDGIKKKKDLVVIDIGSNIGAFSLYVYDIASQIYAIEPLPELVHTINKTVKENQLNKIRTYMLAIGDSTGKRMFNRVEPVSAGASFLSSKGTQEVNAMTLNDFCKERRIKHIDLLKIDTEGEELKIIESIDFEKLSVDCIIGEVHVGNVNQNNFLSLLSRKGYKTEEFGHEFIGVKLC